MSYNSAKLDRPIIVIGAGRSGTTMIRQTLMQHKDVGSFEFEMNALWRYGNEDVEHDMLNIDDHYSEAIAQHIQKEFLKEVRKQGCLRVLDKTVANVMRPEFIQAILPDAKILHVIRDGRAVTASAIKRWSAKQPSSYFIKKVKTVPIRSLPILVFKVLKNKILSKIRARTYRQSWGARWPGFDKDVAESSLATVCAKQWVKQVETALEQKEHLKPYTYMEVRYEELVARPKVIFHQIREFFELGPDQEFDKWVDSMIDGNRTEKWQKDLNKEQLAFVMKESSVLLERLGYKS